MAFRTPFRAALAGLTALAVGANAVSVPDAPLQPLGGATAMADVPVKVEAPEIVKIGSPLTLEISADSPVTGTVQLFLDNVPYGGPVPIVDGKKVVAEVTPQSYGDHTVTARFIDENGFNPSPDSQKDFTTPLPKTETHSKSGRRTEQDSYSNMKVRETTVKPGGTYTATATITPKNRINNGIDEFGLNPPAGDTYVEGSATINKHPVKSGSSLLLVSRGTGDGTAKLTDMEPDKWYRQGEGRVWAPRPSQWASDVRTPQVNKGYVGFREVLDHEAKAPTEYVMEATFKASDVPGLHIPQVAAVKYNEDFYTLVPFETGYRIEAPPLPARKEYPPKTMADTHQPVVDQSAGPIVPAHSRLTDVLPDPEQFIQNTEQLPEHTDMDWKLPNPSIRKPGDKDVLIEVTYPDNSVDLVPTNINVREPGTPMGALVSDHHTPKAKKATFEFASTEDVPEAIDVIDLGEDAPPETRASWYVKCDPEEGTDGIVSVDYPDGSEDTVRVNVLNGDDKATGPRTPQDAETGLSGTAKSVLIALGVLGALGAIAAIIFQVLPRP